MFLFEELLHSVNCDYVECVISGKRVTLNDFKTVGFLAHFGSKT